MFVLSTWWPFHWAATQQMHVNMIYGLPCIGAVVNDHAITRISDAKLAGEPARDHEQLAHNFDVAFTQLVYCTNVLARNDQHMYRRSRVNIVKGHDVIILVRETRRDVTAGNPTEKTGFIHLHCLCRLFIRPNQAVIFRS